MIYVYFYGFAKKILMLVAKSSSELDFSLAYSYLYGFAMKILALAVINIEVNFIFLARLFVSLWYEGVKFIPD